MAQRYLGDDVRHPRRRPRPALPAPRERAGPVARGRLRVRAVLAAQRLGHAGRRQDEQVARQRAARHRRAGQGRAPVVLRYALDRRAVPLDARVDRRHPARGRGHLGAARRASSSAPPSRSGAADAAEVAAVELPDGVRRRDGRRPQRAGRARRGARAPARRQHRARATATRPSRATRWSRVRAMLDVLGLDPGGSQWRAHGSDARYARALEARRRRRARGPRAGARRPRLRHGRRDPGPPRRGRHRGRGLADRRPLVPRCAHRPRPTRGRRTGLMAGNSQRRGATRKARLQEGRERRHGRQEPPRRSRAGARRPRPRTARTTRRTRRRSPPSGARPPAPAAAPRAASRAGGRRRSARRRRQGRPHERRRTRSSPAATRSSRRCAPASRVDASTSRTRLEADDRTREILSAAARRAATRCSRSAAAELDRLTDGSVHQGVAIQVPPYAYADDDDLLDAAAAAGRAAARSSRSTA